MSTIKPIGCFSKLASAKETTGVKIAKTTTYPDAITAMLKHSEGKRKIYSTLNNQTLSWLINKQ